MYYRFLEGIKSAVDPYCSATIRCFLVHFYLTAHFFFAYPKMCPPNGFQFVVVFVVVGVGKVFFFGPLNFVM
jgi:hypothetical protein